MPGRILNAESAASERILLKARLAGHVGEVEQVASMAELLARARARRPDVILLPERLDGTGGDALCRALRADPVCADLPVVLRLRRGARAARLRALEAGTDAIADTCETGAMLSARIRNLMRRAARVAELAAAAEAAEGPGFADPATPFGAAGRIALIVPDARIGADWKRALGGLMRGHVRVLPASGALAALAGTGARAAPDAVVVAEDPAAPEQALRLIADLRSRGPTMRAALLLIQPEPAPERAAMALDIGIDDLVETGFDAPEIALRLRRELVRKARQDRARAAVQDGLRLAVTDPLTGLFNRRYGLSRLDRIAAEAQSGGPPFAVLVLDLDRFKAVNDRFGHAAGDCTLAEVARRIDGCLRQGDLLARIGGEEFLAVIHGCTPGQAARAANRIRRAVSGHPILLETGEEVRATLSIGLAMGEPGRADPAALMARADRALYASKEAGRDRVTAAAAAGPHAA